MAFKLLDRLLRRFGHRVVPEHHLNMVHQHSYEGGYEQYRQIQILHNKRKLEMVWADEMVLDRIIEDQRDHGLGRSGICHGARNGFEVGYLREKLGAEVIGTDISETATQFPDMVVWDFHEPNPEWEGRFDFVYTNSLDQAMDPARALESWCAQLAPGGRIYVEHTMAHSARHAGEMDPFGAHPLVMPYLFFQWGRGFYQLADIVELEAKANKPGPAWIFVLTRESG